MRRILFGVGVIAFSALLIVIGMVYGDKPFARLCASDVVSARLYAVSSSAEMEIRDDKTLSELIDILNSVKVYDKIESGSSHAGQRFHFALTLKDGSVVNIGAHNPFLYIGETSYKTRFGPCQRLSRLGNRLLFG